MRLKDIELAAEHVLAAPTTLYRVQRTKARPKAVKIGRDLRLPPPGLFVGRFDLADRCVGYFACSAETAIYETVARRESVVLALQDLSRRNLLTMRTRATLSLFDLRFLARTFPVLQSLRYRETQELAQDIAGHGFDGIIYTSSQHHGHDCYALFDSAAKTVAVESKHRLVEPATGAFHVALANAIRGSRLPIT